MEALFGLALCLGALAGMGAMWIFTQIQRWLDRGHRAEELMRDIGRANGKLRALDHTSKQLLDLQRTYLDVLTETQTFLRSIPMLYGVPSPVLVLAHIDEVITETHKVERSLRRMPPSFPTASSAQDNALTNALSNLAASESGEYLEREVADLLQRNRSHIRQDDSRGAGAPMPSVLDEIPAFLRRRQEP